MEREPAALYHKDDVGVDDDNDDGGCLAGRVLCSESRGSLRRRFRGSGACKLRSAGY